MAVRPQAVPGCAVLHPGYTRAAWQADPPAISISEQEDWRPCQAGGDRPWVYRLRDVERRRESGGRSFLLRVPALEIGRGERIALTGPSGSGKSTLLDLMALALQPSAAADFRVQPDADGMPLDVAAHWADGDEAALTRVRRRDLGYVLQTGGLLPFVTVRDNLALSRRLLGLPEDGVAEAIADRLGLTPHLAKKPGALSVGERQRVAIARALAHRPAIVIADEPTASLDPVLAAEVMRLLVSLVGELEATVIVASHDVDRVGGFRRLTPAIAVGDDGATVSVFEG